MIVITAITAVTPTIIPSKVKNVRNLLLPKLAKAWLNDSESKDSRELSAMNLLYNFTAKICNWFKFLTLQTSLATNWQGEKIRQLGQLLRVAR